MTRSQFAEVFGKLCQRGPVREQERFCSVVEQRHHMWRLRPICFQGVHIDSPMILNVLDASPTYWLSGQNGAGKTKKFWPLRYACSPVPPTVSRGRYRDVTKGRAFTRRSHSSGSANMSCRSIATSGRNNHSFRCFPRAPRRQQAPRVHRRVRPGGRCWRVVHFRRESLSRLPFYYGRVMRG
jgi:hypothetical protein